MPATVPVGNALGEAVSQAAVDPMGVIPAQAVIDALAQSVDAVVAADERGRVILFNAAAARLWGRDAAQTQGRSLHELLPCPVPAWRGDDQVAVSAYLASMQGCDREMVITTANGSLRRTTMSLSITTTVPDASKRWGYGFIDAGVPSIPPCARATTSACRSSSLRWSASSPASSTTILPSLPVTRSELTSITVPRKKSVSATV
jgi:PAS domain-containing protein